MVEGPPAEEAQRDRGERLADFLRPAAMATRQLGLSPGEVFGVFRRLLREHRREGRV